MKLVKLIPERLMGNPSNPRSLAFPVFMHLFFRAITTRFAARAGAFELFLLRMPQL
jgi:hypothetical protein